MKKILFIFFLLIITRVYSQSSEDAKKILDDVSTKISSFKNISFDFTYSLNNKEEQIKYETIGDVTVSGEKYKLNYLGSIQLFDGEKIYTIIPENEEISVNYAEGKSIEVNVHDGSKMLLHKLNKSYDPGSRRKAMGKINDSRDKGEIITGLIYLDQNEEDLHDTLLTTEKPLNQLKKKDLTPGLKKLRQVNKSFS